MTLLSFLPTRTLPIRTMRPEIRLVRPGPITVMLDASQSRLLRPQTGRLGYNSTPAATGTQSTGVERHDRGYLPGKTILSDTGTSARTKRERWTPGVAMAVQQTTSGHHGVLAEVQPGSRLGTVAVITLAPHVESLQVISTAKAERA